MNYRELFEGVRNRTTMFLHSATYQEASSFVLGCDAGNNFCLLHGFREWLVVKAGRGNNLHWSALVLHLALPDVPDPWSAIASSAEHNRTAINALFDLLNEYFEALGSNHHGLAGLFLDHRVWLERSEAYNPSCDGPRRMTKARADASGTKQAAANRRVVRKQA